MSKYKNLFRSFKIKKLTLKNRIVFPPINTKFADLDGFANDRMTKFYVKRGLGGAALLIIGSAYIDQRAKKRIGSLMIHDDRYITKLKQFTDDIHKTGTKVFQQINHNGRLLIHSKSIHTNERLECIGPSSVPHLINGEVPRAITIAEIHDLAKKFGKAARRVKKA
ncbi:MAG: oxidoreductase, partial [Promethearchaeota archaeon]